MGAALRWRVSTRRRRVNRLRPHWGKPGSQAGGPAVPGRTSAQLRRRTEPLWSRALLRIARMGVGEQSDWQLRRLERARFLREAAERVNDNDSANACLGSDPRTR